MKILILITLLLPNAYADSQLTGYRINHGTNKTIYVLETGANTPHWYKCTNSDAAIDIFIPTKTHTEWDAFLAHTPAFISCVDALNPVNCLDILNYKGDNVSGSKTIDPDGLGGNAAYATWCDMTSDGGGWTLNFDNSTSLSLNSNATHWKGALINTNATEVMVYLSSSNATYAAINDKFKFNKPANFDFFTASNSSTTPTVTNLTNSSTTTNSTIYWGYQNYSSLTCDAWSGGNWGKFGLCIGGGNGTNFDNFPYYNAYDSATNPDYCCKSTQAYNATTCKATNFIAIFER